jgi:hypothetical protein
LFQGLNGFIELGSDSLNLGLPIRSRVDNLINGLLLQRPLKADGSAILPDAINQEEDSQSDKDRDDSRQRASGTQSH